MRLKPCTGCGKRVDTRAKVCPNCRRFLPTTSKKPTVTAMEEVRRGLVNYEDPNRDGDPEEAIETEP